MKLDLKITGGTIHDGTGAPGRDGDVGIRDGRIVAIGRVDDAAEQTIDASGAVVCPGFVDLHTHYDAQVLWDRMLSISPWHGVTTVVMGNCGFGVAPTRPAHRGLILRTLEKVEGMSLAALEEGVGAEWPFETFPQYLDAIEARGVAINVGAMVGHTPVRLYVMGDAATERAATPEEVAAMRAIVAEALDAGALGFASSHSPTHVGFAGKPVPSRMAELAEIRALAGALAGAGHGIFQATVGPGFFLDELAELASITGRPVTWTALLAGLMGPGSHRFLLDRCARFAEQGTPVIPQVTPRPLNFEFDLAEPFALESMPSFAPVSAADRAGKLRLYADPSFRQAVIDDITSPMAMPFARGLAERTVVSFSPSDPTLEGRSLGDLARERGSTTVDVMCDLALESDLAARFRMAALNFDEDEVGELLMSPVGVLGLSDAGAHASQLCDACYATYLLGHWVRDKAAIPMEHAIRILTSRPAAVIGLADRGTLAPGMAADVVVFDPATVGASPLRRVHDLPANAPRLVSDASGIEAVVVNGRVLRRGGRDLLGAGDALPGRLLRGHRANAAAPRALG